MWLPWRSAAARKGARRPQHRRPAVVRLEARELLSAVPAPVDLAAPVTAHTSVQPALKAPASGEAQATTPRHTAEVPAAHPAVHPATASRRPAVHLQPHKQVVAALSNAAHAYPGPRALTAVGAPSAAGVPSQRSGAAPPVGPQAAQVQQDLDGDGDADADGAGPDADDVTALTQPPNQQDTPARPAMASVQAAAESGSQGAQQHGGRAAAGADPDGRTGQAGLPAAARRSLFWAAAHLAYLPPPGLGEGTPESGPSADLGSPGDVGRGLQGLPPPRGTVLGGLGITLAEADQPGFGAGTWAGGAVISEADWAAYGATEDTDRLSGPLAALGFAPGFIVPWPNKDKFSILLVESEEPIRDVMMARLVQAGYWVLPAATGAEAWKILRAPFSVVDLAVLDGCLPDLHSVHLCKLIRQQYPDLPVLVHASSMATADVTAFEQLGVRHYFRKPADLERLLQTAAGLLSA